MLIKKGVYHHLLKVTSAKNLISENIASTEECFTSRKSYALFTRYSMFCISNHSINCKVSDAMATIYTWERVHFVTYLSYNKSLGHKTWPTSRYSYGQYFQKMFWMIGRTGAWFQTLLNLPTWKAISQEPSMINFLFFHYFEGVESVD